MRMLLLAGLLLPILAAGQINRSAKEFAAENVQNYINKKLFKAMPYKSVSYGELKPYTDSKQVIYWVIEHSFEISEVRFDNDQHAAHTKNYTFAFYLDDKMKVKRAETYFHQ